MRSDSNKVLGVCIPTYKRPEQLLACVRSIISSAKSYNVPIFIFDDSTDDTNKSAISVLTREYEHIYYEKNAVNIGIDANIIKSINLTATQYAWPLGEDDRLTPDAIPRILSILQQQQEVAFVFANYVHVDNTATKIISNCKISLDEDRIVTARDFFENYAYTIGFIGGCVVNKALWNRIDNARYMGTYFAHVGTILEYLSGNEVYITEAPLVYNRAEDSRSFTWSDKAFDVMFGWDKMLSFQKELYGEPSYRKSISSNSHYLRHHNLTYLLSKRSEGVYDINIYKKYYSGSQDLKYAFLTSLIAITPRFLLIPLKLLINRYRKFKQPVISIQNCAV